MPRLITESNRIKIKFRSKIEDKPVIVPTVDKANGKLNAKEKREYVERILEDFDEKMKVREQQMRQDLEDAIRQYERLLDEQLKTLPECLWEMPYEEYLRRGGCVHGVMMSLERDKEKEDKENEEKEAIATVKAQEKLTLKRKRAATTKKKKTQKRKKNGKVAETPLLAAGAGEWGTTPMVTPAVDSRLPGFTPHIPKQIQGAKRKLVQASQHKYNTRASVRKPKDTDSPGLATAKEQLSAQLSAQFEQMLFSVKSASDRATLRCIQESLQPRVLGPVKQ